MGFFKSKKEKESDSYDHLSQEQSQQQQQQQNDKQQYLQKSQPPPQQQQQQHQYQQHQQQQQPPPQHAPIPQLSPLPSPGIYCLPQCIAHHPTAVVLRDRLFSFGGDAEIFDVDGRLMFVVRGSAFSMSRRKEIYDAQGQMLFTLRAEVFSVPPSFYCEAPNGGRFMDIDGKWSVFSPKSTVSFVNNGTGQNETIHFRDNWLNTHMEIKLDNGHVIACIDRDFWSSRSFFGANQYVLTIAPGMDIALCVAMCLAMDERSKQR